MGRTLCASLSPKRSQPAPCFRLGPPMVTYRFEDSRSGDCVARHLEGYRGILQIDGYIAYNRFARPERGNDGALLAGCWAHGRRRFYELHANDSSKVATATIERWAHFGRSRKRSRIKPRCSRSRPLGGLRCSRCRSTNSGRTRCPASLEIQSSPKQIRYALNRREAFEQFLA